MLTAQDFSALYTYEDEPAIRNIIMKRLGREKGVQIAVLKIIPQPDCIKVALVFTADSSVEDGHQIILRSHFDLPPSFYKSHLVNEIDEICEQVKEARRMVGVCSAMAIPEIQAKGTGTRGRWAKPLRAIN